MYFLCTERIATGSGFQTPAAPPPPSRPLESRVPPPPPGFLESVWKAYSYNGSETWSMKKGLQDRSDGTYTDGFLWEWRISVGESTKQKQLSSHLFSFVACRRTCYCLVDHNNIWCDFLWDRLAHPGQRKKSTKCIARDIGHETADSRHFVGQRYLAWLCACALDTMSAKWVRHSSTNRGVTDGSKAYVYVNNPLCNLRQCLVYFYFVNYVIVIILHALLCFAFTFDESLKISWSQLKVCIDIDDAALQRKMSVSAVETGGYVIKNWPT